jgi:hypothetical protein
MESNSNSTLQPKCEKQLHVKTSKAAIWKKPHIVVPRNSHHWNKNVTWDLGSLSLNSHTPLEFLWECVSLPLAHVKPYGLSSI